MPNMHKTLGLILNNNNTQTHINKYKEGVGQREGWREEKRETEPSSSISREIPQEVPFSVALPNLNI